MIKFFTKLPKKVLTALQKESILRLQNKTKENKQNGKQRNDTGRGTAICNR